MQQKKSEKNGNGNRPSFVKRVGSVRVSVWEQSSDGRGVYHNAVVTRRYRAENGEWNESNSFNLADIAALQLALKYAADWISRRQDEVADELSQEASQEVGEV